MVGSSVLNYLLNEMYYQKVIVLTRRPLSINHLKIEEMIVNFDNLQNVQLSEPVDDAYCCLGTTMKKAGPGKSKSFPQNRVTPRKTSPLRIPRESRNHAVPFRKIRKPPIVIPPKATLWQ